MEQKHRCHSRDIFLLSNVNRRTEVSVHRIDICKKYTTMHPCIFWPPGCVHDACMIFQHRAFLQAAYNFVWHQSFVIIQHLRSVWSLICWNLFPKAGQQPPSQHLRLRLSSTYRLWASLTSGLSPPLSLHSHPELKNWLKTHSFNHTLDGRANPSNTCGCFPAISTFLSTPFSPLQLRHQSKIIWQPNSHCKDSHNLSQHPLWNF